MSRPPRRRRVGGAPGCALSSATAAPAAKQPRPEARAWTLIDARTGAVLASHAAARQLPIASTTKLMTAYVAMQELPLDKIVRAAPYEPIYGESLLGCARASGSACATCSMA